VLLRGADLRRAMGLVLDAFGAHADHFVFAGSSVLGLYAKPTGSALRTTKDVDCISTRTPWVLQEKVLADLSTQGVLKPDHEVQCRYRVCQGDVDVDVLSPEGKNVGGVNPWFERACKRARPYVLDDGRRINAISPPFFLATKVVAFANRGPDAQSSKDVEDIVTLAVEVDDLVEQVDREGLRPEVAVLWKASLAKYGLDSPDMADIVEWHLHQDDRAGFDRIVATLTALCDD
jgi:hypothetical protein